MYMIVAAGLQTGIYRPAASMIGGLEKKAHNKDYQFFVNISSYANLIAHEMEFNMHC